MPSPPRRKEHCLSLQTSTTPGCGRASFSQKTPRRGRGPSGISRSGSGCSALPDLPGIGLCSSGHPDRHVGVKRRRGQSPVERLGDDAEHLPCTKTPNESFLTGKSPICREAEPPAFEAKKKRMPDLSLPEEIPSRQDGDDQDSGCNERPRDFAPRGLLWSGRGFAGRGAGGRFRRGCGGPRQGKEAEVRDLRRHGSGCRINGCGVVPHHFRRGAADLRPPHGDQDVRWFEGEGEPDIGDL